MSRHNEIGKIATSVYTESGCTSVRYHSTEVVKFNAESIVLNAGGYFTNTTKVRMNQTSAQFDLGFQVYQVKFNWFVSFKGQELPFDGSQVVLTR